MFKRRSLLIALCFCFLSLTTEKEVGDSLKYKMFVAAIQNQTPATNFLVAIVKNTKTGEKKEICVEAPALEDAISKERNINILLAMEFAKKQKDRTFEFSKEEAFIHLGYDLYTPEEFAKYQTTMDVEKLVRQVKNGLLKSKTFPKEGKELNMYAHMMFNHGVMMSRNLTALKTFDFTYFDPK